MLPHASNFLARWETSMSGTCKRREGLVHITASSLKGDQIYNPLHTHPAIYMSLDQKERTTQCTTVISVHFESILERSYET